MEQHSFTFPPHPQVSVTIAALAEVGAPSRPHEFGMSTNVDGHVHPHVAFKAWNLAGEAMGMVPSSFEEFVEHLARRSTTDLPTIRRWFRFHGLDVSDYLAAV